MGRKYELEHPEDPYDLTDVKGIAAELIEEASDDASAVVGAVAHKVRDIATDVAESASDESHAAYTYPRAYVGYALRKLKRHAQLRPMGTVLTAAAIAFVAGALWDVVSRPRT